MYMRLLVFPNNIKVGFCICKYIVSYYTIPGVSFEIYGIKNKRWLVVTTHFGNSILKSSRSSSVLRSIITIGVFFW